MVSTKGIWRSISRTSTPMPTRTGVGYAIAWRTSLRSMVGVFVPFPGNSLLEYCDYNPQKSPLENLGVEDKRAGRTLFEGRRVLLSVGR